MKAQYTHEELAELKRTLSESLSRTEEEYPDARPLPPMEEEEARDMLLTLVGAAKQRPITADEAFLFGQLVAAYRMAIEARMLGRKGRYYVLSESQINDLLAAREQT